MTRRGFLAGLMALPVAALAAKWPTIPKRKIAPSKRDHMTTAECYEKFMADRPGAPALGPWWAECGPFVSYKDGKGPGAPVAPQLVPYEIPLVRVRP